MTTFERTPRTAELLDPLVRLREYQAGRCAVCDEERKRLYVDHDHATGLVRGLLCNGCNTSEGRDFRAPWFREYRKNPPAGQIGLEVEYGRHEPYSDSSGVIPPGQGTWEKFCAAIYLGYDWPEPSSRSDPVAWEALREGLALIGEAVIAWDVERREERAARRASKTSESDAQNEQDGGSA